MRGIQSNNDNRSIKYRVPGIPQNDLGRTFVCGVVVIMMLKRMSIDEFITANVTRFGIVDLRHKAWFKKPPSYFEEQLGLSFEDTYDDLDYLKRAFFSFDDGLVFSLFRYKNQPDQNMTVMEMPKDYSAKEVESAIQTLRDACQLKPDEIVIINGVGVN
jgi:hypothetical protein